MTAAPRNYRWRRRLTSDQWSGLLATFGDHQQLGPPDALARLTGALEWVIDRSGGTVHVVGGTHLQLAGHVCGPNVLTARAHR